MRGRLIMCCVGSLGIVAAHPGLLLGAEEASCSFFKTSAKVNVFKEARGMSDFIGMLEPNDVVCVHADNGGGPWAFVVYKLESQNRRKRLEGWAITRYFQPASPEEVAALQKAPAAPPRAAQAPAAPPPTAKAPAAPPPAANAPATSGDVVRFSEPITVGPPPVNGQSLEQLITGTPLFPPIEGLEDRVWKKSCPSCHRWERTSLCVQAGVYAKDPKAALRVPHPYGGPEKVAMIKWSQGGCP